MLTVVKKNRYIAAVLAFSMVGVFFFGSVSYIYAIARGYATSDTSLTVGMVAALSESGDSEVERADQTSGKRIVGVVTTVDDSSVTVASESSKVLIESEGDVTAYVSDVAGAVKKGDLLMLSAFKGVLMKGSETASGTIIGVAAQDSASIEEEEAIRYTYIENGANKSTRIVKLKINLNKQGANAGRTVEPSPLSKIGESVTGKQVSDIRVLAALIIFILVLIAEGGIIYGAVTSAITALGRNPLARKMIRREMLRIIFVAISVLAVGLAAVYGILWY